jgi:hypothetical protein
MGKIRTFVQAAQNAAFDFWEGLQTTFSGIKTSIWIPKTTDTNANAAIKPKGNGANVAQDPDGTATGGNARGEYATDWQKSRSANTQVASGNYSIISGGNNNTASGLNSIAIGTGNTASGAFASAAIGRNNQATGSGATAIGTSNISSGTRSAIGGGFDNDATAEHSTVGGGELNIASGAHGTVSGGEDCTATAQYATVGGGKSNDATEARAVIAGGINNSASGSRSTVGGGDAVRATGDYSTVSGGRTNRADGDYSTVSGGFRGIASRYGQFAHSSGRFVADGDAQYCRYIVRTATTDATANVELFLDGTAGSNRITIPEDTAYQFHIYITSIENTGNNAKSSEITGLIRRQNGGNATIVGQHTDGNKTFNDGGFTPSYTVSADTTNQSLKIDVTGLAATNIHTVATVDITEVKYA